MKEINIFCNEETLSGRLGHLLIDHGVDSISVSNAIYHRQQLLSEKPGCLGLHRVRFLVPEARANELFEKLSAVSNEGPEEHQFTILVTPVEFCFTPVYH